MRSAVLIRKNIFANGSEMGCQPKRSSQPYSTEEPFTQPCGALRHRVGAMGIGTQFKYWHGIRDLSFVVY